MELKELLSGYVNEEKIGEVVEKINQDLSKGFIPKSRFNEINEELKLTKGALENTKKTYEELKGKAESVEEYQNRVAELEKKNQEIEEKMQKEIIGMVKKTKFRDLLTKSGASVDALDLLTEKYADGIEIENESIKGADELIAKIKEERKTLFMVSSEDSKEKGRAGKTSTDDEENARLRKYFGLK